MSNDDKREIAEDLNKRHWSKKRIAEYVGVNVKTVRTWLDPVYAEKLLRQGRERYARGKNDSNAS